MTEYEQAALALMEKDLVLDAMSHLSTQDAMLATDGATFLTLLFGYLIVAYLIGKNFTTVQVAIFNTLYLLSILGILSIMVGHLGAMNDALGLITQMAREYGLEQEENYLAVDLLLNKNFIAGTMILNSCSIMASLYFMWSMRHPSKAES